jgi:hypothetical protein
LLVEQEEQPELLKLQTELMVILFMLADLAVVEGITVLQTQGVMEEMADGRGEEAAAAVHLILGSCLALEVAEQTEKSLSQLTSNEHYY